MTPEWEVAYRNGSVARVEAATFTVVEGGALLLRDSESRIVIAFGPHAWSTIYPVREDLS